jgi:hypothetical protein
MGHVTGAKNYKKEVLLVVMNEVLLSSTYKWKQVCTLYKEKSSESEVHDKDDVKCHWIEEMCNKFKKPTSTGNACLG